MKLCWSAVFVFLGGVVTAASGSVSYVVLQDSDKASLIRISADGKSVTTIADGAAGTGLTVDSAGNYVVAARSALLRVTRAGQVTTLATAPSDSRWVAVVADRKGNLIVADGAHRALWRVSEDGRSIRRFAEYSGSIPAGALVPLVGLGLALDPSGDVLLLRQGGHEDIPRLYRVTPAGDVSTVLLSGVRVEAGGPMVPDGTGNYLFTDPRSLSRTVYRVTPEGVVTAFAEFEKVSCCTMGLARNPETGEVVVLVSGLLLSTSPEGSRRRLCRDPRLGRAMFVIVEAGTGPQVR